MGMVLDGIAPWTSARITIVVDYMTQVFNEFPETGCDSRAC